MTWAQILILWLTAGVGSVSAAGIKLRAIAERYPLDTGHA